uniref:hypothetical protein n=1 Tax=Staphylococcus hominis TaxID=1290 RepID=UPI001C92C14B
NPCNEKTSFKLANSIISIRVALLLTILPLIPYANTHFSSIPQYYNPHLYHLPHPKNILNLILLDFPPIDTLFQS